MEKFNKINFIKALTSLGQRQGDVEIRAAEIITDSLEEYGIDHSVDKFITTIPVTRRSSLSVDGKEVPCKGSSFISGSLKGKDNLISSLLTPSQFDFSTPNINFNPYSDKISLSSHYFAPSVAVDKQGLKEVVKGGNVYAEVEVEQYTYESRNILVGNTLNPENILFAHYDSIEQGATDNASSVAVLMALAISFPEILLHSLIVFSGNEELSYDQPIYWGHGYRVFEKMHRSKMEGAKRIFVLDCVGNGKTVHDQDKDFVYLSFPITNLDRWSGKISAMRGDFYKMLKVYHSEADDLMELDDDYLEESLSILVNTLKG
jgi:hypothetical protein